MAVPVVLSPFDAISPIIGYGSRCSVVGRQVRDLMLDRLKGDIAARCGDLSGYP
jgi:hypothetical protein